MSEVEASGLNSDAFQVAPLRSEFRANHCVRIRNLLQPPLLAFLKNRLPHCHWEPKTHGEIGVEYITNDPVTLHLCHFLANLQPFRQFLEQVTECSPLNLFSGRVYRMDPGLGHFDSWHDDDLQHRLIGMSINLSPAGYRGGLFQMRERGSTEPRVQIANTGFGDALIFRISDRLEHRVSPIEGDEPKAAFAGWFQSHQSDYFTQLLNKSKPA